ncbi:class I SAM-dependent methyltransferase [Candidatus Sumerlaeota bacterium]|nr:class I SAM-dependent methyltransferase [Candidatus Sumerlaeota bacterium]
MNASTKTERAEPETDVERAMEEVRERARALQDDAPASAAPPFVELQPAENGLTPLQDALDRANHLLQDLHSRHALVRDGYALDASQWNQLRLRLAEQFPLDMPPPLTGGIKGLVRKITAKIARFFFTGQESYNQQMRVYLDQLFQMQASQVETLNALTTQMRGLDGKMRGLDGKMSALDAKMSALQNLERDVNNRQTMLLNTLDRIREGLSGSAPLDGPWTSREARLEHLLRDGPEAEDFDFLAWEEFTRGEERSIGDQQEHYATYFIGHQDVLDIGCGRGEFLEVLRRRGIPARGVDSDAQMTAHCQRKGLAAELADGLEYLRGLPDAALGGIFAAQVVEHLTVSQLSELARHSFRVLRLGSPILLETMNPSCLSIFSGAFYADPTHVKPVHPLTVRFFLRQAGFRKDETLFSAPVPEDQKLELLSADGALPQVEMLNKNLSKLNSLLYSHAHYAVLAFKPAETADK